MTLSWGSSRKAYRSNWAVPVCQKRTRRMRYSRFAISRPTSTKLKTRVILHTVTARPMKVRTSRPGILLMIRPCVPREVVIAQVACMHPFNRDIKAIQPLRRKTIASWGMVQRGCVLSDILGLSAWGPFWPMSLSYEKSGGVLQHAECYPAMNHAPVGYSPDEVNLDHGTKSVASELQPSYRLAFIAPRPPSSRPRSLGPGGRPRRRRHP